MQAVINACSFAGQCFQEVYWPKLNRPTDNLRRGRARENLLDRVKRAVDRKLAKVTARETAKAEVCAFADYGAFERAWLIAKGCYYGDTGNRDREMAKAAAAWRKRNHAQ